MAKFEIVEGKPGQGKSLYTARLARKLVKRNLKYLKKTGKTRFIFSNIKFSPEFETESQGLIKYWRNTHEIVKLRDCDLLWDEIATELDSRNYSNLSEDLKIFLSQYRKRGVDIYANTQDFSMIDFRARLMVTNVKTVTKLIGSPDPTPTKPPIKKIWGIILVRDLETIFSDDPTNKKYSMIPTMFFIEKEDIEIYDTRQDIPLSPPLPKKKVWTPIEYIGGEKDGNIDHRYF